MVDNVNHPAHYTQFKMEVIELTECCDFLLGNAYKYILRSKFKGKEKEDLEKARWYINRFVEKKFSPPYIPDVIYYYFRTLDKVVENLLEYCDTFNKEFLEAALKELDERIEKLN